MAPAGTWRGTYTAISRLFWVAQYLAGKVYVADAVVP